MDFNALKIDIKSRKYSQKRIGELIGVKQSTVSYYLNEKRKMKIADFQLICETLDLQPYKYFIENKTERQICQQLFEINEKTKLSFLTILQNITKS